MSIRKINAPVKVCERYVAVRETDNGQTWFDLSTASGLPNEAEQAARAFDEKHGWRRGTGGRESNGMPFVRVARVRVTEIEE